jgi:hypothetical protein
MRKNIFIPNGGVLTVPGTFGLTVDVEHKVILRAGVVDAKSVLAVMGLGAASGSATRPASAANVSCTAGSPRRP